MAIVLLIFVAWGQAQDAVLQLPAPPVPPSPEENARLIAVAKLSAARAQYAEAAKLPVVPDLDGSAKLPKLKVGARDPRIPVVRQRLAVEYPADPAPSDGDLYDAQLAARVKLYQQHHGIGPDPALGRATVLALNTAPSVRVAQLDRALERYQTLHPLPPGPYLRVNVPAFELRAYQNGVPALRMRIIVGKQAMPTPLLESRVNEIVLNPVWTVPLKLAKNEILPKMRRSAEKAKSEGFQAVRGSDAVDVVTVDWKKVPVNSIPYVFKQAPGKWNPLGHYMFRFPNKNDVYLHDTNNHGLFRVDRRTLSHGCVRIDKPKELAMWLLNDVPKVKQPKWDEDALDEAVATGETNHIWLPKPVPVQFVYETVWVDETGELQYRDDIYGLDQTPVAPTDPTEGTPAARVTPGPPAETMAAMLQ